MMADLKPYPAYKHSGFPWLDDVPEQWEVRKLRNVLARVAERGRPDLPLLSVVREKGVIQRDTTSKDENHNFIPDDLSNYKVVRAGQFAMNKMKAWQGSYGVSQHDGIVSPAYFVFDLSGVGVEFFHSAIRSRAYVPFFAQASDGVRIGQWDLAQARMNEIPFCVPSLPEQAAIVRFLDHADRRIRRYINAKRKLIALLNEQKQAIIHRAVTRGLDPSVRLKPSGVEWLGDVPQHWEICKLRQCGAIKGGMTPSMEVSQFWGGDIPWVTPKDMKSSVIGNSSVRVTNAAIEQTGLRKIGPGAVLLVVRGMILARRVPIAWTNADVTINQDMKALVLRPDIAPRFMASSLESAQGAFAALIDEAGHGTRRLPTERWRDLAIALPPPDEQFAIVGFIENATKAPNAASDEAQREIDLLREFRTRLIADVVTGKLDVRVAAAALPDEAEELEQTDEGELLTDGDDEELEDVAVEEEALV